MKYRVDLPDGNFAERRSNRTYTHVVAAFNVRGWWVRSFCGSAELAAKQLVNAHRMNHRWPEADRPAEFRVLPVRVVQS